MLKELTFNTGRDYAPEGQIIHAKAVHVSRTLLGSAMLVLFHDQTRHIYGKMTLFTDSLTQEVVMEAYDNNRYEDSTPTEYENTPSLQREEES